MPSPTLPPVPVDGGAAQLPVAVQAVVSRLRVSYAWHWVSPAVPFLTSVSSYGVDETAVFLT